MLNHWLIYTFRALSSGRGTKFVSQVHTKSSVLQAKFHFYFPYQYFRRLPVKSWNLFDFVFEAGSLRALHSWSCLECPHSEIKYMHHHVFWSSVDIFPYAWRLGKVYGMNQDRTIQTFYVQEEVGGGSSGDRRSRSTWVYVQVVAGSI